MEDRDFTLNKFDSLDIMSPDEVPNVKFTEKENTPIRNPIMDSPIVQ